MKQNSRPSVRVSGFLLGRIYSLLLILALPFILIRLLLRSRKAPAYARRWNERLAVYHQKRSNPEKSLVWVHAVSVGETEAAIPLIHQLKKLPDNPVILITSTTPTGSARVLSAFEGGAVEHVYLPYDIRWLTNRFIAHYKPCLAIIMETEIWPNLYRSCAKAGIPLLLANARLSERSARGYQRIRWLVQRTFRDVYRVVAQTGLDAARFSSIGCPQEKITTMGNIKFDFEFPVDMIEIGKRIRRELFADRMVWVAASTHDGEDQLLIEAHQHLLQRFPDVLLVLVPRHPERFREVADLVKTNGLSLVKRSSGQACISGTQVFLLDSMGELKTFYAAADIAFVGGSLTKVGGHNVLEPAALGKPVVFGLHTFNFQLITESLLAAGGAIQVSSIAELQDKLIHLVESAELRQQVGEKAFQFVQSNRGAIDRLMEVVHDAWNEPAGLANSKNWRAKP